MRFIFRIILESLVGIIRGVYTSYKGKDKKGIGSFSNNDQWKGFHEAREELKLKAKMYVTVFWNSEFGYIFASHARIKESGLWGIIHPVVTKPPDTTLRQLGEEVIKALEKSEKALPIDEQDIDDEFWRVSGANDYNDFSNRFQCVSVADVGLTFEIEKLVSVNGGYINLKRPDSKIRSVKLDCLADDFGDRLKFVLTGESSRVLGTSIFYRPKFGYIITFNVPVKGKRGTISHDITLVSEVKETTTTSIELGESIKEGMRKTKNALPIMEKDVEEDEGFWEVSGFKRWSTFTAKFECIFINVIESESRLELDKLIRVESDVLTYPKPKETIGLSIEVPSEELGRVVKDIFMN